MAMSSKIPAGTNAAPERKENTGRAKGLSSSNESATSTSSSVKALAWRTSAQAS